MSQQGALLELVRRHYANMSRGDVEADRQIMSTDVVTVDPSGTIKGLEGFLEHERVFARALPDARAELIRAVEAGDIVMAEGVFSGTHTGPLATPAGEVPPTGKTLHLEFADVFVMRDGLIVEHHIYYDQIAFLSQLGLLPTPGS
jgi:steroid delta-isomerase-like uncharacterized protein